jgi:protein arginine N-methyltransferase 1
MIEFQRLILGDARRNELFAEALKRAIAPGRTTVADLGAGTGYLSFVARRLGAKHCFLVEQSELIGLAQRLAKANRIDGCTFIHAHSAEIAEPPRVDLLVSETLGNLAFEENLLETLQDARRWLAPGGTIVPQQVRQYAAPVIAPRFFDELDVFSRIGHGLDFTAARTLATDNVYVRRFAPEDLLQEKPAVGAAGPRAARATNDSIAATAFPSAPTAPPSTAAPAARCLDDVDLRRRTASVRRGRAEWKLPKATVLHGFALWWECELLAGAPDLVLSTSPLAPPTHWEQVWLPPRAPLAARAGDTLALEFECDSRPQVKINLKWKVTLRDRSGALRAESAHDMRKGYLE